jgi:hypothetical protein
MSMRKVGILAATFMASGLMVAQAFANPCPPGNPPTNCAPPSGAILDLDGTTNFHGYTQYTANFTATDTTTNLSFAFREDPAFLSLDDVAVQNLTTATALTLVNPGFEDGVLGDNAPVGWTYLNTFGAGFAGVVTNNNPHSGSNNYYDGAVQAYDGITQAIATTIGDLYQVSFWLADNSGNGTYSRLSTNGDVTDIGGNGIDLLVYAGAVPTITPLGLPEPVSLGLVGIGLAGLGFSRRRKV